MAIKQYESYNNIFSCHQNPRYYTSLNENEEIKIDEINKFMKATKISKIVAKKQYENKVSRSYQNTCYYSTKNKRDDVKKNEINNLGTFSEVFWKLSDKCRGVEGSEPLPLPEKKFILQSGIGAFTSIGALSLLHYVFTDCHDYTLILGSFGASAVLLFGAPTAPFSQPRNVIGGHLISAIAGVSSYKFFNVALGLTCLAPPVGVGLALMGMQATRAVHPPAGGTALIAVLGSPLIHQMGYSFIIPTFLGSTLLVGVACIFNNLFRGKLRYPQYWF